MQSEKCGRADADVPDDNGRPRAAIDGPMMAGYACREDRGGAYSAEITLAAAVTTAAMRPTSRNCCEVMPCSFFSSS